MQIVDRDNQGPPFRRFKALIIEGDKSVARLFAEVFAYNDWDAETCGDAPCATEAISGDRHYDIILVSYKVPGTNGVEMVKMIRALDHRKGAPVLMVTGTQGVEEEALQAGANEVLHKPIDINTLVETARKYTMSKQRRFKAVKD